MSEEHPSLLNGTSHSNMNPNLKLASPSSAAADYGVTVAAAARSIERGRRPRRGRSVRGRRELKNTESQQTRVASSVISSSSSVTSFHVRGQRDARWRIRFDGVVESGVSVVADGKGEVKEDKFGVRSLGRVVGVVD